jgi:hypothetical protein
VRLNVTGIEGRSGLDGLAADLDRAAQASPAEVRKVVAKGALNIKTDARKRASGIAHAPTYPYTITYDTVATPSGATAEIGPDKDKQVGGGPHRTPGNLAVFLEFGGPHNAPQPHLGPALETERPKFERALSDLEVRLLEGRP